MMDAPAARDLLSNMPICHLSYLLDKFRPRWYIDKMYTYIYTGSIDKLKMSRRECDPVYDRLEFVGSLDELLQVPETSPRDPNQLNVLQKGDGVLESNEGQSYDLDLLDINKSMLAAYQPGEGINYIINTAQTQPGYFWMSKHPNTDIFVRSDVLTNPISQMLKQRNFEYVRTGPALTVKLEGFYMDNVPTGCCPEWPSEAAEWIARPCLSGWPTRRMKQAMASRGCHFVAKPHRLSLNEELEFRFSFVFTTKKIIEQITTAQRQCYIIFKTLVKHKLGSKIHFSTYCLKTIFLWNLEKIPRKLWEYQFRGLAGSFTSMLNDLIHGLTEHHIQQYYIPQSNLVDHVSKQDLRANIKDLCELRKDPLATLMQYDDMYYIIGVLPFSYLFKPVVDDTSKTGQTFRQCLEMYLDLNIRCVLAYVITQQVHGALHGIPSIYEVAVRLQPLVQLFTPTTFLKDIVGSVQFDYTFGKTNRVDEAKGFLAALSSIVYLDDMDGPKTNMRKMEVESTFRQVLQGRLLSTMTHMYCAIFLQSCGQFEDSIAVLKSGLEQERINELTAAECLISMRRHLDDILQYLLKTRLYMSFPPYIMIHYLLIRAYITTGRWQEANKQWDLFSRDCDSACATRGIAVNSSCYILLAWSGMRLGRFWEAGDAFSKDTTMPCVFDRDNTVKMWICKAIALYFYIHNH